MTSGLLCAVTFIRITSPNYTADSSSGGTSQVTRQASTLACAATCSEYWGCTAFNYCARPANATCTLASTSGFRHLAGGSCEMFKQNFFPGQGLQVVNYRPQGVYSGALLQQVVWKSA